MTKEDKELLIRDLSSRLSYGVRINGILPQRYLKGKPTEGTNNEVNVVLMDIFVNREDGYISINNIWSFTRDDDLPRPYLRPLSSMTEEERDEFRNLGGVMSHNVQNDTWALSAFSPEAYDWLFAHNFDIHDLIKKGLALEAPKDMYKL